MTAAEKIKRIAAERTAKANGTSLEGINLDDLLKGNKDKATGKKGFKLVEDKDTVKFRIKTCAYFPSQDIDEVMNSEAGSYSFTSFQEEGIVFTLPTKVFHNMIRGAKMAVPAIPFIKGTIAEVQYYAKSEQMYSKTGEVNIADKDGYYLSGVEFTYSQNFKVASINVNAGIALQFIADEDEEDEDLSKYVKRSTLLKN
jgi:hypothetical protein